jgi:hypothetical protein
LSTIARSVNGKRRQKMRAARSERWNMTLC